VLNALLWIAKAEVPASGAQSEITSEQLKENLDLKGQSKAKSGAAKAP
jgi:hypothetical protein